MVIDSLLKCVQTYHVLGTDVDIKPGRNLIRDDLGRALMASKPFQDMINAKALGFAGQVTVAIPPAADPATVKPVAGAKAPATPPDGETAVSGMNVPDAVKVINECKDVDQLRDILVRDPRAGIKKAVEARIDILAGEARDEQAKIEAEKKAESGNDDDDDAQ